MDDTISRQAAINVVRTAKDKSEAHRMLVQLPPAQPVVISKSENTTECEDAVSRADVDILIEEAKTAWLRGYCLYPALKKGLQKVQSVTPKQPGWIPWDSGKFPEESGTYTVTAYDGATKRVTYAKYQKRLKRWELTGARAYWRVLAWMPHIEPWEGGQNAGET